ncbi:hypothetical protein HK100_011590 [Physocladia obscura]|uniref:Methyltransferase domain-containing protein n=1 Tax=Physocladia obscura TaxID=109957 RepID=A0AAD5XGV5_9FUNG|nr:hypothetical protein HK100_011590 [Physocladia obscura]
MDMSHHQSAILKNLSHVESESANIPDHRNANSNQVSFADGRINKLQAKVWNPNNPESWESDLRGYHSVESSDYALPSDEIEQNRLEIQHYILRAYFHGDVVCPEANELIKNDGVQVLDVGCAKGFWLESLRKENPFSEYHGVDIAENLISAYGNISIKFGNILERLPYDDNTFDYVHERYLVLGIPKDKFPDAIRELIRVTKPGGWIELVETDVVIYNAGPHSKLLSKAMLDAMHARGLDCYGATNLEWNANSVSANVLNQGIKTIHGPYNNDTPLGKHCARDCKSVFRGVEN